jgi:hypothetical protein
MVDQNLGHTLIAPHGFVRGDIGYVLLAPRPVETDSPLLALVDWLRAEARATMRRCARAASGRAASRPAGSP